MGVLHGTMYSDSLGLTVAYTAVLPENEPGPYPVLYLLHGKSDDDKAWLYKSSLVRYVQKRKLAVLMPQVHLSYYTDMKEGGAYWKFLTEEFPRKMHHQFRLSEKREETFAAGLSMGGYGAFKWALQFPEQIAGAVSLSGALDVRLRWEKDRTRDEELGRIFGSLEELQGSDNDLLALVKNRLPQAEALPAFLQICGTEDFLYEANQSFRQEINQLERARELDYTYLEEPGAHTWDFWDKHILTALEWLDQRLLED